MEKGNGLKIKRETDKVDIKFFIRRQDDNDVTLDSFCPTCYYTVKSTSRQHAKIFCLNPNNFHKDYGHTFPFYNFVKRTTATKRKMLQDKYDIQKNCVWHNMKEIM